MLKFYHFSKRYSTSRLLTTEPNGEPTKAPVIMYLNKIVLYNDAF